MTFHFFSAAKTSRDEHPTLQAKHHRMGFRHYCNKPSSASDVAATDLQDLNEINAVLSENLPESEAYASSSTQSSGGHESFIEIPAESEISINEALFLENPERLSRTEEIIMIKHLLKLLAIPRQFVRRVIKLSKKNRVILLSILKICLLCLSCYYAMIFVSKILLPFLMSALRTLKEKLSLEKWKTKQSLNNTDQAEESKRFWDTELGSLSQVLKISRGGNVLAIREANIYNFSELDRQQAFLFISPIPAYIKLERAMAELDKFLVGSGRPLIRLKRLSLKTLKEFSSKLKKFSSKLKKFIPFSERSLRKRVSVLVLGLALFGLVDIGNTISKRNSMVINSSIVSTTQVVALSPLPIFESSIDKVSMKLPETIKPILPETKDIVKTPSRLVSETQARKRAKLVQLKDLKGLTEENFDREIESISSARPIAIRIRVN